jgi:histone-lysine N-methyltransferase SETMAR
MTRRQSNNQWSGGIAAHTAPKMSECKNQLENISLRCFWDQDGITLTDYLPKGQSIKAEYYLSLLVQLKDILKEKRRRKFTKRVLFFHDNAPSHRTLATHKKLAYLGIQYLGHPPYSPDLTPSEYAGLKKQLEGRHFSSVAEVIAAVETWLDGQFSDFFLSGLQKLEQRTNKYIELRGEYVE